MLNKSIIALSFAMASATTTTCDGWEFTNTTFTENLVQYNVTDTSEIFPMLGSCANATNNSASLCAASFIASLWTDGGASASCMTCITTYMSVTNSTDAGACISSCNATSCSDSCDTALIAEMSNTCNVTLTDDSAKSSMGLLTGSAIVGAALIALL